MHEARSGEQNSGWYSVSLPALLALEQQQDADRDREQGQQVATIGEADFEERRREQAEQDEPNGQQQHPQILGQSHDGISLNDMRYSRPCPARPQTIDLAAAQVGLCLRLPALIGNPCVFAFAMLMARRDSSV